MLLARTDARQVASTERARGGQGRAYGDENHEHEVGTTIDGREKRREAGTHHAYDDKRPAQIPVQSHDRPTTTTTATPTATTTSQEQEREQEREQEQEQEREREQEQEQ